MSDSAVADAVDGGPGTDNGTGGTAGGAGGAGRPAGAADPRAAGPAALSRPVALLVAALAGLLLTAAFPGADAWPAAVVAVAGLALAVRGHRAWFAAVAGLLFGLAFFVPHLHWSGIYVGWLPWFALATVESLYLAAMAAALPRIWRTRGGVAGAALAGAGLWVAQELVRGSWPFGGFPWGRLAFSQSGATTAGLAALGGAPLVTAAVAAAGTLLAVAAVEVVARRRLLAVAALAAAGAVVAAGLVVPRPAAGQAAPGRPATVRVAAVQGNTPREGLDFNAERRAVLDNHAAATMGLAARVRAGRAPAPDLVIWPENASDIDPLRNADAAAVIADAVAAIDAPTLVGAVLRQPADQLSNVGIVWRPGLGRGTGDDSVYVKRHPAPFAEYIPYRSFFRRFSTQVDLVTRDFVSGDTLRPDPVGVLSMGPARVGDVICFEVAYDGLVRDPVRRGATLLAVQTNNATFGRSAESVQQLAMSRLRAVETGRTVVHVSTVGVSALILPDGTVTERSQHFTQQVLTGEVPLRSTQTVATRVGAWPERALAALGVLLVLLSFRRRRSTRVR